MGFFSRIVNGETDLSIFEMIMLLCFGSAWPFSIYRSWTSRSNKGKSLFFLVIVLVGYVSGCVHKLLYSFDGVVYLYAANGIMVSVDMVIYARNQRLARRV
jgi:hypothetical protein